MTLATYRERRRREERKEKKEVENLLLKAFFIGDLCKYQD
jgi:hypothetical protein